MKALRTYSAIALASLSLIVPLSNLAIPGPGERMFFTTPRQSLMPLLARSFLFKVFFGSEPHNYAQSLKCDRSGYLAFFRRMLEAGVFLTPSQYETDFISAAHGEDVIQTTLEAFSSCLKG